jgi:hypothetical protein
MGSGIGPRIYGVEAISIKFDVANKSTYIGSGSTSLSLTNDILRSTSTSYSSVGASSYFSFGGAGIVTSSSKVEISGNNSRVLSAWVYFTSAANQGIISIGDNGTGTGFSLETTTTAWKLGYGNSGVATTVTYATNTWYHAVYVGEFVSASSMNLKLYINGILRHSSLASNLNTTNTILRLGSDPSETLKLNGYISSATCYKRSLSDKEILSNYISKKSRYGL